MISKDNKKELLGIALIIIGFVIVSYIVQNNLEFLQNNIKNDFLGMITYVSILIISAVVAPIDVIIIMPIAIALWGWFFTALLSLLGWTIGSAVVFVLARKFGVPLIRKLLSLEKIYKYEKFMPQKHIFAGIIFLRIAIPVDIVSYAIGLFTKIRFVPYIIATVIGFLPLAFFLAYLGTLPLYVQVIGFAIFLEVVVIGYLSIKRRSRTK